MATSIELMLGEAARNWTRRAGASKSDIDLLLASSPCPVPSSLVELLEFSNGGDGDLALPPRLFMLDSVSEIVAGLRDPFLVEEFPGFVFFGGNGGLERIALDVRSGVPPFPVVMIDPIAGPDSAEKIAPDVSAFVTAIGVAYADDA